MKESHGEGPASHADPEPCSESREALVEALEGAHTGQPLSCEITKTRTPTPLTEAEGNIVGGNKGKPSASPAQSKTLSMRGNFLHGNRETPRTSAAKDGAADRSEKAKSPASDMHVLGESDDRVVPEQPAKEDDRSFWSLYERVSAAKVKCERDLATARGRRSTKGNMDRPAATRTQSRGLLASPGLDRVREVARRDKRAKFTALLHHISVESLRESFHALKHGAAPGVDGVTWQQYEEGLEDRLMDLHRRVHRGTYRARPRSGHTYPSPTGSERLGIAAFEDKIVQHAVVTVSTRSTRDFRVFPMASGPDAASIMPGRIACRDHG